MAPGGRSRPPLLPPFQDRGSKRPFGASYADAQRPGKLRRMVTDPELATTGYAQRSVPAITSNNGREYIDLTMDDAMSSFGGQQLAETLPPFSLPQQAPLSQANMMAETPIGQLDHHMWSTESQQTSLPQPNILVGASMTQQQPWEIASHQASLTSSTLPTGMPMMEPQQASLLPGDMLAGPSVVQQQTWSPAHHQSQFSQSGRLTGPPMRRQHMQPWPMPSRPMHPRSLPSRPMHPRSMPSRPMPPRSMPSRPMHPRLYSEMQTQTSLMKLQPPVDPALRSSYEARDAFSAPPSSVPPNFDAYSPASGAILSNSSMNPLIPPMARNAYAPPNRGNPHATGVFGRKPAPKAPSTQGTSRRLQSQGSQIHLRAFKEYVEPDKVKHLFNGMWTDMEISEADWEPSPDPLVATLLPHQRIGITWMKQAEQSSKKGGILADAMGLGKTMTTLALMLLHRSEDPHNKTNLVVAPVSLLKQWEAEIRNHVKEASRLNVLIYHNTGKKVTATELQQYDVVITTLGVIHEESKKVDAVIAQKREKSIDWDNDPDLAKFPILHPTKSKFYRMVIDEAHYIKNKAGKQTAACRRVKATYRWCLTGTPMMNSITEIFSLIIFLDIPPYNTWDAFKRDFLGICSAKHEVTMAEINKVQILLKALMLRRTKESTVNGKPILSLPPKVERLVTVKLEGDELKTYEYLDTETKKKVDKYLHSTARDKKFSNILVALLRTRQACCHPHLLLDVGKIYLTEEEAEKAEECAKALPRETIERLKDVYDKEGILECPICYEPAPDSRLFFPCGHTNCSDCYQKLLDISRDSEEGLRCPECRSKFNASESLTWAIFQAVHMPEFKDMRPGSNSLGAELNRLRTEGRTNKVQRQAYEDLLTEKWIDSAKSNKCIKVLKEIQKTSEKTIVFSQWTMVLDILEMAMRKHIPGVKCCRYTGDMSTPQRNAAAQMMQTDPDCKVMFVSLKAGNAGLNLTAASNVILMDPFWNPYTEDQAIDRAHRIGQTRPVTVYRIIVEDSIEHNIMKIQEKKRGYVDGALSEKASKELGKLTNAELGSMFGIVV